MSNMLDDNTTSQTTFLGSNLKKTLWFTDIWAAHLLVASVEHVYDHRYTT